MGYIGGMRTRELPWACRETSALVPLAQTLRQGYDPQSLPQHLFTLTLDTSIDDKNQVDTRRCPRCTGGRGISKGRDGQFPARTAARGRGRGLDTELAEVSGSSRMGRRGAQARVCVMVKSDEARGHDYAVNHIFRRILY